jgi:hypothetical protein
LTIISDHGYWGNAIFADINGGELRFQVVGDILFARSMDESHVVSVFVDLSGVTSVASSTDVTAYEHLSIDASGSHVALIVVDVESIGNGRGRSLRPA